MVNSMDFEVENNDIEFKKEMWASIWLQLLKEGTCPDHISIIIDEVMKDYDKNFSSKGKTNE